MLRTQMERLGALPYMILGGSLLLLGLIALDRLTNIWLFDPQQNPELLRVLAQDQATSTMILDVALPELILAFLHWY